MTEPAQSSPSRTQLLSTARTFIDAYRTWTVDAIMEHRSPDCISRILPASRKYAPMNNAEYEAFFSRTMPLIQNFTPIEFEDETMVDTEKRKVFMHLRSTADTVVGAYANEYSLVMTMTEGGDKVCDFMEFVDSAYSEEFFPRLRAKLEQDRAKAEAGASG